MTTNHPVPTPPPSEPAPSLRPVEELQALCDAATDGPWFAAFNVHGDPTVVTDPARPSFSMVAQVSVGPRDYGRANAEFIAAARTAVPSLLARLRAAEETLAAVGALAEKLLKAMEIGGFRQSLVAQAVAVDLCDIVSQEAP